MSFMAKYDFDIQYKPGKDDSPSDYLSRPAQSSDLILTLDLESQLQHVAENLKTPRLSSVDDQLVIRGTKL